ncbi:MAG: winged helix DNA-binding domain-containing protein [Nocardioides sp.]|uniref:winged helix DNA-binding domain-containing protein n=1 Tax=Nocardioides sp. TaxID=35761 RepID=UPI0039E3EAF7
MTGIELTATQARRLRHGVQLLGGSELTPARVVEHMVGLQGQDLPAVLRAIAIRSRPGTSVADVRAAFDAGDLVRSWPMRGTLFATTPDRLATLLHFTAERTHRAAARRRGQLGLDDATIARGREALVEALSESGLRRAEVLALWQRAGIATDAGRGYHLLVHLCVDGVAHWGAFEESGREQLLTRTEPVVEPVDPEAALAEVVGAYVAARGPVTEADLAWWTKLPVAVLRRARARVAEIETVSVAGEAAWAIDPGTPASSGVTLVPGFDEWILGYGDRSLIAGPAALERLVPGGNGIFRPAVLLDGVVVGTWRAARAARGQSRTEPEVELVEQVSASARRSIARAAARWPHG